MAVQQVSILNDFISLFFPNTCLACHDSLPRGLNFLCPACQLSLPKTDNHLVEIPEFERKLRGLIDFEHVLVYMHFQKQGVVQRIMHELKYNHKPELGELLGRWYGAELKDAGYAVAFDCVMPVPLHKSRLRSRGYNQSDHFAMGLAAALGVSCETGALIRTRANETQTRKSRQERWQNVEGLFEATDMAAIENKHILLVDDVLTTGSTLIACGEAIVKARPRSLSFGLIASAK